jgi:5-methylthioadenosine/S-adenosylhomocysteine deaminase
VKKKFEIGIFAETLLPMSGGKMSVEKKRFLGINDGKIAYAGPWKASLKSQCKKFIDGTGMVALPGFVNGHTHLPMTLFRGLEDDVPFHVWLFERILPLEGQMVSRSFVKDGTELAALECIRFGVTTVNEMYFYAGETAAVLERAGIRAIVSQTMADFPLPEDKDLGADKFALVAGLQKKYRGHTRIEIGFGPHAPYSCGDELLKRVATESKGAPIHIHVSETAKEVKDSQEKYGISPVERLDKLGILRPRTICAHCVHLDAQDREIFVKSGASAVYNPDSNAKLCSGIAPVADYIKRGIPVAFGTDGAASNNDLSMFGAMDLGTKLQKLSLSDPLAMKAADALLAATYGGARALGLENVIGSLEEGKSADIVLVDLSHPHLQPVNDPVSHLVYSAQGMEVDTVLCEGKVLLEGREFRTLKAEPIYKKAESWRKKIAANLKKLK